MLPGRPRRSRAAPRGLRQPRCAACAAAQGRRCVHKQADTGMIKHGARALKRGAHLRHRQIACLRISCWLTCEFEVVAGRVLVFCAFESVDLGQTERSVSCARARRGGSARFVRRAQRGAVGRRYARVDGVAARLRESCGPAARPGSRCRKARFHQGAERPRVGCGCEAHILGMPGWTAREAAV